MRLSLVRINRGARRCFSTAQSDQSFRQRMKNTPVDDRILSRLRALGLGSRRGEGQANRHVKRRPMMLANVGRDLTEIMDLPSAFEGKPRLVMSAGIVNDFPPVGARKEIAFAGRANVGKSSLLNRLLGRSSGDPHAAHVDDKPGVTRRINFYDKSKKLRLVDLPGYGFAFANQDTVQSWTDLVMSYLLDRECLSRVYVLVDGRHGLRQADKELLALLDETRVKHQLVLTKGDLVKQVDLARQVSLVGAQTKHSPHCLSPVLAISSKTGAGMEDFRERAAQTLPGYKECFGKRKREAIKKVQAERETEKERAKYEREAEQQKQHLQNKRGKQKALQGRGKTKGPHRSRSKRT